MAHRKIYPIAWHTAENNESKIEDLSNYVYNNFEGGDGGGGTVDSQKVIETSNQAFIENPTNIINLSNHVFDADEVVLKKDLKVGGTVYQ